MQPERRDHATARHGDAPAPRAAWRAAGWLVNGSLRGLILYYAAEALARPDDPRYAGKGIPIRNLVLAGAMVTLVIPLARLWRRSASSYPVWQDNLLLSVIALDMTGNALNLYESRWRFDLIPHAYGPAAGYALLRAIGVSRPRSAVAVNAVHALLELQEALGDRYLGTHNVRGWWDTASDLLAGALGSIVAPAAWRRLRRVPGSTR